MASIGPTPIKRGSTPHCAYETILHNGFRFLSFASDWVVIIIKAAPSFMPDALPAVIVPFASKQGFSLLSPSRVVFGLGYSSAEINFSSFLTLIFIGT